MATEIWVNIGSGNGLLPDGTKPLPEPMLTYQWGSLRFIWGQFHKRYPSHQSLKWAWKTYFISFAALLVKTFICILKSHFVLTGYWDKCSAKGCHLDNHEHLSILIANRCVSARKTYSSYVLLALTHRNDYTLACIISQVPANGFCITTIHWTYTMNLKKAVTLTTTWCPWTLNNHNSLTGCWDWCSSSKGCNLDNHQGCHLMTTAEYNTILNACG